MSRNVLIECQNIGCTFYTRKSRLSLRKVRALQDVSLELKEGETLGIIGHNGAGKSTLLQILSRILVPTSGKISIQKHLSISLLRLQMGFSPELSGRENAVLGAMYLGFTKKQAEERLKSIQNFAEIGDWIDEPIRTYSTGMGARLGFAVALEMMPDVLLIDETLGVGDAYFQQKSSQALLDKMAKGQTTVLVAHNKELMEKLCSQIIWLHEGKTRMQGEPSEVLNAYDKWVNGLVQESAGAIIDDKE